MGYWKRLDTGRDFDFGGRDGSAEEAYRAGYEKGYRDAMMRVQSMRDMEGHGDMGFRDGDGMDMRMYPQFPPRAMGMRESDPYGDMGARRYRRRADGRFM